VFDVEVVDSIKREILARVLGTDSELWIYLQGSHDLTLA